MNGKMSFATIERSAATIPLEGHGMDQNPFPAEWVPSRYARKVGDIDVLVVSDGILSIPAETMATNADPAERSAWLNDRFLPEQIDWAVNEVVVRSGNRTILIDSGLGMEYPDFPRTGQWNQRVKAAGIELESVTDVVLTHMHFDHIGGLLLDSVKKKLRTDLRVHVSAAEAESWESPDFSRTAMTGEMQEVIRSAATRFLNEYRGRLRTFESECEVAPGVVTVRTGGHTPGHSVVRLASGGDRLTFVGDAVLPASFDNPGWHNGFEHDPEEATRVRIRLLRELAASREPMVATHLPFPSVCHVAADGEVFRWVPAVWEY